MWGKTVVIFTVSVLLMAGGMPASAETGSETITVTATKSREALGKFAKAFATPTKLTGKIARWERRVCPVVVGQTPNFTRFVTQRVKYIALAAGAHINTEASCTPNIEIVFTTTPQALLDNVKKDDPVYLGYATSSAQQDELATVTRPIQAWYTTETVDLKGRREVDRDGRLDTGRPGHFDAETGQTTGINIRTSAWTGNHIDGGIHSGFNHILIVIDSTKLAGQKVAPLTDYISMLALTQLNSLDACPQLPSIVNILAANCDHAADGLTQFDLAYLQGLYKMSASSSQVLQQDEIVDEMTDRLAKPK